MNTPASMWENKSGWEIRNENIIKEKESIYPRRQCPDSIIKRHAFSLHIKLKNRNGSGCSSFLDEKCNFSTEKWKFSGQKFLILNEHHHMSKLGSNILSKESAWSNIYWISWIGSFSLHILNIENFWEDL